MEGPPQCLLGLELLSLSILCWGIAWHSQAGRRCFVVFLLQCGSSEFIPGEVEGESFLRVPWCGPRPTHEPPRTSSFQGGEVILAFTDPSLPACRSCACESSIKAAFPIVKGQEVRGPHPPPASGTPEVPSELPQDSTSPTPPPLFWLIHCSISDPWIEFWNHGLHQTGQRMAQPVAFLLGTFCRELISEPGAPDLPPLPASPRPHLAGDVLSKVFPHLPSC